jgi:AcrR family transcriptional regulator
MRTVHDSIEREASTGHAVRGTPQERRRTQTVQEILDAALDVMAEDGVASLNLTRVAQQVGLRQPSLYRYFRSREAVYDALFERGMKAHLQAVSAAMDAAPAPGWAAVRAGAHATLRFTAAQPVLAQLLFQPAVPGFQPSERSYAPSLDVQQRMADAFDAAVDEGQLHPAAATDRGLRLFIAVVAGVASERAANQPHLVSEQDLDHLLTPALDMYGAYFTATRPATWSPWPEPDPA